MRTTLLFPLVALVVLPAQSMPNSSNSAEVLRYPEPKAVIQIVHDQRPSEMLSDGCSEGRPSNRAYIVRPTYCRDGFARHSSGRCFKIVDKPQDGRPVSTRYSTEVFFFKFCVVNKFFQKSYLDLGPHQTLDFCAEDGGCKYDGGEFSVVDLPICSRGWVMDITGECKKVTIPRLTLARSSKKDRKKPKKFGKMSTTEKPTEIFGQL